MLVKALIVHTKLMPPDDLHSTKSINSPSDMWQRLLEAAIREALAKALQKTLDEPRKRSPGGGKTINHYEGNFKPLSGLLHEKTHSGNVARNAAAVLDAFAENCCFTSHTDNGNSFHLLYEPQIAGQSTVCPMCSADYDLFQTNLSIEGHRCQLCSFVMPLHTQTLDICQVEVTKKKLAVTKLSKLPRREDDNRLQRLFFSLLLVKNMVHDGVGLRSLNKALMGRGKKKEGGVIGIGTENSAKGINTKRGAKAAVELHDNLLDGRCGKDNNPDLRVYLLTGSVVQWTPDSKDLDLLRTKLQEVTTSWDENGHGRLVLRGELVARFDEEAVASVMTAIRTMVHSVAESNNNSKLATCCPILNYSSCGPEVTLLCSGNELVRAVGWRVFTSEEEAALAAVAAGRRVAYNSLPGSWSQLSETGLTWDMLIFARIVTYCALDRHIVLKESATADFLSDGLTFYKISVEMEASIRALQTEDAATNPMGHPIRVGYSIGLAVAAHRPAPLCPGRGITSDRSAGLGPDHANLRNLIGNVPNNHYSSSMKLIALLHDFGARMQEDSLPLDVDAMRHDVFRYGTETFLAASHHSLRHCSHLMELQTYLDSNSKSCHPKVSEWIDDATGLMKQNSAYVERGQAICFIPRGELPNKHGMTTAEAQPILRLAKSDMWIINIEAR